MLSQLALDSRRNILGLTDTMEKRLSSTYLPKNLPMASSWANSAGADQDHREDEEKFIQLLIS